MRMDDLQFEVLKEDFSREKDILRNNLRAHAASKVKDYSLDEFLLLYKRSDVKFVAGFRIIWLSKFRSFLHRYALGG